MRMAATYTRGIRSSTRTVKPSADGVGLQIAHVTDRQCKE